MTTAKKSLKKKFPKRAPKPTSKSTSKLSKTKPAGSASLARAGADFERTFQGLRKVLAAFAPKLRVTSDEPRKYYLVTKANSWRGGPMFFGAVMQGKAYISYHLMALYLYPELKKSLPPELNQHMQGKACFNFRAPDDVLFRQLKDVTRRVLEKYRAEKWL
jgi:hypothetical protein